MSGTTASAPAGKSTPLAGSGTVAPELLWAQRSSDSEPEKNVVMLTINVPNLPPLPETKLDLTETGFDFKAKAGDAARGIAEKEYAFHLDFFAEIDPKESKIHQSSKSLYLILRKKETKEEYWPRLSKDKIRLHNVKTDFDKWRDEDEQDDLEDLSGGMDGGMGGMDPSMLSAMGGAGGMGGMPGMGGMGGMGGGGMGGMDLQSMLASMGGGGAGGPGGMPDFGDDDDEGDDEGEDVAEEATPADAGAPSATSEAKISEA